MNSKLSEKKDSILLPNIAAAVGALGLLGAFIADAEWETQELTGIATFGLAGLVIGILCLANQKTGRVQAIAGIVTGSISLIVFVHYFAAALR